MLSSSPGTGFSDSIECLLGSTWAPGLMFLPDLCCWTYFDIVLCCFQSWLHCHQFTNKNWPTVVRKGSPQRKVKRRNIFYVKLKAGHAVCNCMTKSQNWKLIPDLQWNRARKGGGPSSFFCFCFQNKWFLNGGRKGFILQFLWLLDLHFIVLIKILPPQNKELHLQVKGCGSDWGYSQQSIMSVQSNHSESDLSKKNGKSQEMQRIWSDRSLNPFIHI